MTVGGGTGLRRWQDIFADRCTCETAAVQNAAST